MNSWCSPTYGAERILLSYSQIKHANAIACKVAGMKHPTGLSSTLSPGNGRRAPTTCSKHSFTITLDKAGKVAGMELRGLHSLRDSFASNLYARGVKVKIIPRLLGHASV